MAYPERKSHTISVTTSAVDYYCPTDSDGLVALKNIGANAIWVNHLQGSAAALEGANCEPILAGETVYVYWRGPGVPYSLIAATGTTKLVMTAALSR